MFSASFCSKEHSNICFVFGQNIHIPKSNVYPDYTMRMINVMHGWWNQGPLGTLAPTKFLSFSQ